MLAPLLVGVEIGGFPCHPGIDSVSSLCVEVRDDVLMMRMVAGDDSALGEAFDRYAPVVLGIARRVTRSAAAAEDVVQEVFTGLWSHPERYDPGRGSLRAYLGVQAYRRAVDAVRREARRHTQELTSLLLTGSPGAVNRDEMDAATLGEVVRRAIGRLPEDQRRAVTLAFWEGCTHQEVAQVLGIPPGTAKSRLRLAQEKLVRWLADLAVEPV